ncbi:SpoIIE family protein phosphatase [Streptomyces roseolus]|uniref:SpoIIE family protein phosphatase n=1 Tax=Streptomyces roseolus TaxID=67358 RepID=UPI0037A5B52F
MKAGETTGGPDGPGPDDSGTGAGTGPHRGTGAAAGGRPVDPRMFDGTVAAVVLLAGPEGRLLYTNSAFTRLFGARRLGLPAREAFPDSDGHRFLAVLESVRDTGRARQVVGERRPDPGEPGQARHFVYSCSAVTTDQGPGILVLAMDTTAETLTLQRYEALATALHAVLRRRPDGTWRLTWSSAGHPPPLVVPAVGDAGYLPGAADPPLCVASDFLRTTHAHVLGPGDTLLLYTDGLIETPSAPIDEGQRRLASEAVLCRRRSLPDLLRVLQSLSDHRDDTAMPAFRVDEAP